MCLQFKCLPYSEPFSNDFERNLAMIGVYLEIQAESIYFDYVNERQGQEREICYKDHPISKISRFWLEEFSASQEVTDAKNLHKYRRLKEKKPSRTRSQETTYLY